MFLGFGGFMIVPGILALAGVPVELKFFGIEVDTQRERAIWTVGSLFSPVAGYAILRKVTGDDDEW